MAEQLKEAVRARDSAEAGLKTIEKQFENIRKQLHYTEINLATEKQLVIKLCEELRKASDISWGKAFDVAGVLANSGLRRPESIYYDPEIRQLSNPNSSHPEQATQVSELPKVDQIPPAPLEVPKDSH